MRVDALSLRMRTSAQVTSSITISRSGGAPSPMTSTRALRRSRSGARSSGSGASLVPSTRKSLHFARLHPGLPAQCNSPVLGVQAAGPPGRPGVRRRGGLLAGAAGSGGLVASADGRRAACGVGMAGARDGPAPDPPTTGAVALSYTTTGDVTPAEGAGRRPLGAPRGRRSPPPVPGPTHPGPLRSRTPSRWMLEML
jgi:hypothetical protein